MSHSARMARQARVLQADYDLPGCKLRPLNPEWDRKALEAFEKCDVEFFANSSDREITEIAGSGAHELRTWVAALSSLKGFGEIKSNVLFYEPVKEWITGMGVMTASLHS